MSKTITISISEYIRLLEKSIKFNMAKNYVEKTKYISDSDMKILLDIENN